MVTVLVTARSVSGPSTTRVAVALLNAGTGFGSNVTGSVMSVICTGAAPLLVTTHSTVVSPLAGSHSALAANTTAEAASAGAAVVRRCRRRGPGCRRSCRRRRGRRRGSLGGRRSRRRRRLGGRRRGGRCGLLDGCRRRRWFWRLWHRRLDGACSQRLHERRHRHGGADNCEQSESPAAAVRDPCTSSSSMRTARSHRDLRTLQRLGLDAQGPDARRGR